MDTMPLDLCAGRNAEFCLELVLSRRSKPGFNAGPCDLRALFHERSKEPLSMLAARSNRGPASSATSLTVPELEQSKINVLATLPSAHSRRAYTYAIERFLDWYCAEPRLGFNRCAVVLFRSFLEGLALSAATIDLHLSAIRRLAD